MSTSYTFTSTFTRVHAQYLASKVAADLRLCHLYYGQPGEEGIQAYMEELTQLLTGGYVARYEFGFKRGNLRVVSCLYNVRSDGTLTVNDNAGRVYPGADIRAASFFNYLTYSTRWSQLPPQTRATIEAALPVKRTAEPPPQDGTGYWTSDKVYTAAGTSLQRQTFRPT